jgi:hypothetical protein
MLKKIISLQIFQKTFYYFSHYENALFFEKFQHFYTECNCSGRSQQGTYNPRKRIPVADGLIISVKLSLSC